ncbi:hypothetical protein J6590_013692 [Homalodisca vitripennis]|nr:hypothetical protein J6590_013692 [Homalodisca vitripennis]
MLCHTATSAIRTVLDQIKVLLRDLERDSERSVRREGSGEGDGCTRRRRSTQNRAVGSGRPSQTMFRPAPVFSSSV